MDLVTLLGATNQGLSAVKNIAEAYVGVRDQAKLLELRIQMQTAVIGLQSTVMDLLQKQGEAEQEHRTLVQAKHELEEKVRRLETKQAGADEKELVRVCPGFFALADKRAAGVPQTGPYYCQACSDDGKSTVLRQKRAPNGNFTDWKCPVEVRHGFRESRAGYVPRTAEPDPFS